MDIAIEFLEQLVHDIAKVGIVMAELAGILILLITVAKGLVGYFRKDDHIRLDLAEGIALALEFKLGGEVLRTVIVREWTELLILGAIIALRGALTLLIHWEIRVEEQRENKLLMDHKEQKKQEKPHQESQPE